MARKATRDEIVDNLNARIRLGRVHGENMDQLRGLLDALCRQHMGITSIAEDTVGLHNCADYFEHKAKEAE